MVNYGLKQGQITPNIGNKYVLKLIYFAVQCSKITNTVLFLKHKLHDFLAFLQFFKSNVRMSEGTFCHVEVQMFCPFAHFLKDFPFSFLQIKNRQGQHRIMICKDMCPNCYMSSFVAIGLPVSEKIFEGFFFLPHIGMVAILVR